MKSFIQTFKIIILSLAVITAVSYVQAEWNPPTIDPTGGNAPAPINVSDSDQIKEGGITLGGTLFSPKIYAEEICFTGDDGDIGGGDDQCLTSLPDGF